MKSEELKRYFDFFTDCWKFFKKYSSADNTEEYWQAVDSDSQEIAVKYGRTRFVNKIVLEILLELEGLCKKGE